MPTVALHSESTNKPLRVLSLPHYAGSNPYQQQLNGALRAQGVGFLKWERQVRLSHLRSLLANRTVPDILHQQWIHVDTLRGTLLHSLVATMLFFFQLGVLRLLGMKIVWTLHNKTNHDGRYPRLDYWIRRKMCSLAHRVIVHSEAAAQEAGRYFDLHPRVLAKLRALPHAGYSDYYPDGAGRAELRARLGIPADAFCYGFLGRLESYKGIEELVKAFRSLEETHVRLLAAGEVREPGLFRWLHEQCAADSRIVLVPERVPESDFRGYCEATDAMVYPYRGQLTSGAVLAAASCGCALVLPDESPMTAGLPQAGYIRFQRGNGRSLADTLREVFQRDTRAMGAANRQAMEDPKRSWASMAKRTQELYAEVLQ